MVSLNFTLSPESSVKIHDALLCLAKFSESVSIEARQDKALLSVFKGRIADARGRDSAIDRCEVSVQERPDEVECRLVVKMVHNQGVTKTYKLTYESVEVMHALFDKNMAQNRWKIQAGCLKEFIEYFGPKTEQLDIYSEDGRVTFMSFTEKITDGKNILKHPLQTAVSASTADFEEFSAQEKLHIIISVKDFKAIVTHADNLRADMSACYSQPTRPLQFSYGGEGMHCEFTLMTAGDYRGTPAPAPSHAVASRSISRAQSTASARTDNHPAPVEMPPPSESGSRASTRRNKVPGSARPPASSNLQQPQSDPEPLFVPLEEEDRRWDPVVYRDEEETLGWTLARTTITSLTTPSATQLQQLDLQPTTVQRV
ncbi:hypothetical protein H2199_003016 [Coniosporium tulheliwenetii]|uniref:Uncharacterized protein n=1 Tax=Coniosporium tulheliwenetii TaxID=3383036 RepID=A0ACC2ZDX6_9PEZI|nr:hypothetical protein H2199_003016 [Cladosporium sp. JES 115]